MNESRDGAHPARYALLILPIGVSAGFPTVTMAWLLHAAGVMATDIAALIALSYLPHTWKFFWAPMVVLSWRRKAGTCLVVPVVH